MFSPVRRVWRRVQPDQIEYVQMVVLAAVVGVCGALGNLGFRGLIVFFSWFFRTVEWNWLGIGRGGLFLLAIPIVLWSGGVVVLILERIWPGDALGYGFPKFLEMVNLRRPVIAPRWIFLKAAGAALSLGAGASVGREGPIAQIGGAIGSAVAQLARFSTERIKVLVACGAGAGIATTFNAPIGGLMFAQEIVLLGETGFSDLTLLIIATTSAVVTSRAFTGNVTVFHAPQFILRSYWELFSYAIMGVLLGLLSVGYIRLFYSTARFFRRMSAPQWAKLAVGMLAVGLIAIPLPRNLSDGYPAINEAFAGQLSVALMAALAIAKLVTSSVSLGCGMPGGSFGPIFFIGAMAGGTLRAGFEAMMPTVTGPRGSYALVGLGAFLGGTTHAPLTALFLLFEMTRNYEITLPAMISTILALLAARALERESLDTYALAREGKTLEIGRDRLLLAQLSVDSVMTVDMTLVHETDSLQDILEAAGETAQGTLPVVDDKGAFRGLIVMHDLLTIVASGSVPGTLLNAYDISRNNCPTLTSDSALDLANQQMDAEGLDELPVVDRRDGNRLLGLVTRHALTQALNRARISISALSSTESAISWTTGYRVARIMIPVAAKGATLRGLNPRARFGVTVLALHSAADPDSGFAPADPDSPLMAGDLIIAAGRSGSIQQFEDELKGFRERL